MIRRHATEDRQAFLLTLSDALRPLADALDVQATTARLLGEHLGASRAAYAEIDGDEAVIRRDYVRDVASMAGRWRVDTFGRTLLPAYRRGETVVVDDAARDRRFSLHERAALARVDIAAYAAVMLVKNGRWVAALTAHDAAPRIWTRDEVGLLREVAERTWAAVERARAEAASRQSETKFRTLIESIDQGVCLLDVARDATTHAADLRIAETNPAWHRHTGLADLTGRNVRSLLPPDEHHWIDALCNVALDGVPVRFEHYVRTADRWYDVHATRVGDGARVALLVDDITDRKRAEADVRESRATLAAAVEAADLGVWQLDLATDHSSARSLRHDQMFGYTVAQTEWGRAIAERHVVEEDRPAFRAAFARAVETGILAFDVRVRWADGSIHWIAPRGRTFFDASGHPTRMAGVVADVTDRKRVEAEREDLLAIAERARAEAERANDAKDAFLAVLSHELRAPMNAILGWLRILKTADPNDRALVGRALDTLERNVTVQAQVIDDLLDVSRIMSGKLELEATTVELTSVVAGCVESLRPSAAGKRIRLTLRLPDRDLDMTGDAARLQQIVSNLVGNALKFTDPGGRVKVTVGAAHGTATVVVEDSGHGIAPEFLPHIFERFSQGDASTMRRHGGLGLGLAIVKNLVALHGGEVRAASPGLGRGARFTVTLPLATKHAPAPAPPRPATVTASPLRGKHVLVVEDEMDSRQALELSLRTRGAHVRAVGSVAAALAAWEARAPDVIVSDIGMPGQDGYALIGAIRGREDGRRSPTLAIAVTGFAGREDRQMALRAGFDEHLAKPIDLDVLCERIRALESARRPAARRARPRPRPAPPRPPATARVSQRPRKR